MSENTTINVHWSFWLIGALALFWNSMGVLNFIIQMDENTIANLPELERAIIEARPSWAFGAFGVAVITGSAGSLLLLIKKSLAHYFFIVSFIGVIIQAIPYFMLSSDINKMIILIFTLIQICFSLFLVWISHHYKEKGWVI